jgi:hypothetical protein
MLIPLPNITYNTQEAIDYYESVKAKFQDLKLSKKETVQLASFSDAKIQERIDGFLDYVKHAEPFVSWPREQIIEFIDEKSIEFSKDAHFWFISSRHSNTGNPKLDRQEELRFGFAKKLLDNFPESFNVELVVNPVGTVYKKHTDKDRSIRIIIPIIADEGAVWHFDNEQNVNHFPGQAYLLLKEFPHATNVYGPSERVSIHFQLKEEMKDWLMSLNRAL